MTRALAIISTLMFVIALMGCEDDEATNSAPVNFGTGGAAGEMMGTAGTAGAAGTPIAMPDAGSAGQGFAGTGCDTDADCASGICRPYGPGGENICVDACGMNNSCPAGSACNEDGLCEPGTSPAPEPPTDPTMPTPPVGPALDSCAGIVQCLQDCGPEDQMCQQSCVDSADEASRTLYLAAAECIRNSGCEGNDNACINTACGMEINACLATPEPTPEPEPEPEPEPVDPPAQDLSCADLLDCLQACGPANNECSEDCLNRSTPDAQAAFNTAIECVQNSDCEPEDQACINEDCAEEINACSNPNGDDPVDPVDPVEPPAEPLNCLEALDCLDACAVNGGDQAQCTADCDERVSDEGRDDWLAALGCLDANDCESPAACAESCSDELAVCRGESPEPVDPVDPVDPIDPVDPVDPAPEDTACRPLGDCIVACDDVFCQRACLDSADADALAEYEAIGECLTENDCFDAAQELDFFCLVDNCLVDYERCFAAPTIPEGQTECRDFLRCLTDCDDEDADCLRGCVGATSRESYQQYENLVDCWGSAPCEGEGSACRLNACNVEYFTCFEAGVEFGDGLCGPIRTCIDGCDDEDRACSRNCFDAGTQDAQRQYTAYSYCTADTDCDDLQSCADACPRETAICEGEEIGPAPGDEACLDYYICRGGCDTVQCLAQCEASADAGGVERFNAIQDCANDNRCFTFGGGLDEACFEENCTETVVECIGESPEPTGEGGCGAYVDCANECDEGDLRCRRDCLANTSQAAYDRLVAAVACIEDNCPNADAQCIDQQCSDALDACLEDG